MNQNDDEKIEIHAKNHNIIAKDVFNKLMYGVFARCMEHLPDNEV